MFEEIEEMPSPGEINRDIVAILPKPKFLIVDLSLVSGMDTASYGVFSEIRDKCKNHDCRLFLSGLSTRAKKGLALAGISPDVTVGRYRKQRMIRFFRDLDFALGKAEDLLLELERMKSNPLPLDQPCCGETKGFLHALRKIDELHGQQFTPELCGIEAYVSKIELQPGGRLYHDDGGLVPLERRGLFFIECGELRIERDTLTMTSRSIGPTMGGARYTLRHEHGRMASMARRVNMLPQSVHGGGPRQNFRVMRIGPGW